MTDRITIPPEAVEAAARADYEMTRDEALADHGIMASLTYCPWENLSVDGKEYYMKHATAALRAGIAAWPGMEADRILRARNDGSAVADPRLILPTPTENTNAET